MTRERGSGVTPERVVVLLKKAVEESSMLAVSQTTGLGLAAIGRYLKGVGEPTTATLKKLADHFGTTVAYLRGDLRETVFTCAVCGSDLRAEEGEEVGRLKVWPCERCREGGGHEER
jgi:transcriptional regulator with XRE-family HTH domain